MVRQTWESPLTSFYGYSQIRCFIYLYNQNVGQCSSSSSLSSSSSSHSRNFGVVSLASEARCQLPAHEGCAAQRHEVDLAGPTLAHRGKEDLLKIHPHPLVKI